jgi:hypothetical protein
LRNLMMEIYLYFRSWFSPFIWVLFYKRRKLKNFGNSQYNALLRATTLADASRVINSMGYRYDHFRGLIDATIPFKYAEYFFSPLKFGRDCDDFARMWTIWGEKHGYKATEVAVTDKCFKKAHMFTVLAKGDEYVLCDYTVQGISRRYGDALGFIGKRYDEPVFAVYNHKRELF